MVKKAKISQAREIQKLIGSASEKNKVLERSLNSIYENIRDFWLYFEGDKLAACCALHIVGWQSLAEIKSLVVSEGFQRRGLGIKLVQRALSEAKELGVNKVFALTFSPLFFKKQGFSLIDKNSLPHKVWTECVNCEYFPDCREEAVIIET